MKHNVLIFIRALRAIAAMALLLSLDMAYAAEPGATVRNLAVASTEHRVALVIGNNAYQHVTRLNNAVGDARAMAQELRGLGFDVIEKHDVDQRNMKAAVREFVQRISNGGVGAFFYAGHGVQEGGNNFLLPVDISALSDPSALPDEAVELNGEIMARIGQSGAKFSLLVIDACRDNPFPKRSGRSIGATRGLTAATSAPEGMVVVYSAGVGQQALDRLSDNDRNPNGLFTREFIREIRKPGLEVSEVVMNVRKRVKDQAAQVKHEQTPAIYIQADRFYLTSAAQSVTNAAPSSEEDKLWATFAPSMPCDYRAYLDQYPQGRYVALAKQLLTECLEPVAGAVAAAGPRPSAAVPPEPSGGVPGDAETRLWNQAKSGGKRAQFHTYLKQYANGKYADLARAELKKLDDRDKQKMVKEETERRLDVEREKQELARGEKESWERAKAGDSKKAYAVYLEAYPKGRFVALARISLSKASIAGD